jgi:pre-mRNA-processing factor 6
MPQERALLEQSIVLFPAFDKFYLMLGQLEERQGRQDAARAVYRCVGLRL